MGLPVRPTGPSLLQRFLGSWANRPGLGISPGQSQRTRAHAIAGLLGLALAVPVLPAAVPVATETTGPVDPVTTPTALPPGSEVVSRDSAGRPDMVRSAYSRNSEAGDRELARDSLRRWAAPVDSAITWRGNRTAPRVAPSSTSRARRSRCATHCWWIASVKRS